MTRKPNKINGKKPATQKDLSILAGHLTDRLDRIGKKMATKDDLHNLEKRLSEKFATKENQQRILSIVESIDQHFKEHKELPQKVEKLEVDVFKLKTHL